MASDGNWYPQKWEHTLRTEDAAKNEELWREANSLGQDGWELVNAGNVTSRRDTSEAAGAGQVDGRLTRREAMRRLVLVGVTATPTALSAGCSSGRYGPNRRRRRVNVLDYGADPTGVNDSTTAFTKAIAALPPVGGWAVVPTGGGVVYAPTGSYKISRTLAFTQFQNLRGDGRYLTNLIYTGTGPCISATNTNTPTGWSTPCGFEGFSIDGTSAGTGAIGLQIGNLFNSHANDIQIQDFTSTGAIGLYFKNYGGTPVMEKIRFTGISVVNNTSGVVFDGGGTGASFDYSVFEFHTLVNTNQSGVTLQNHATLDGCKLSIVGNYATAATSNTGCVLGLDVGTSSGTSSITNSEFFIAVEADGSSPNLGHTSIVMGSTVNGALTGAGVMSFEATPSLAFQGAAIAVGSIFGVSGRISDPVLGTLSFNDCANFQGGTQRNAVVYGSATIASRAAGLTLEPQLGDVQEFLLPNTVSTVTISAFLNAPYPTSRRMEILFHQPASGSPCAVTWPSNVKWAHGKNTLSTANGAIDKVRLDYFPHDDIWFAELLTS
jgi:hypothetical protein